MLPKTRFPKPFALVNGRTLVLLPVLFSDPVTLHREPVVATTCTGALKATPGPEQDTLMPPEIVGFVLVAKPRSHLASTLTAVVKVSEPSLSVPQLL